eukprot:4837811-Prymnesium_polylepis.1
MAPKLDKIAREYPSAAYYSIESVRNGKAAGERMHTFFLGRNAVRARTRAPHSSSSSASQLRGGAARADRVASRRGLLRQPPGGGERGAAEQPGAL